MHLVVKLASNMSQILCGIPRHHISTLYAIKRNHYIDAEKGFLAVKIGNQLIIDTGLNALKSRTDFWWYSLTS